MKHPLPVFEMMGKILSFTALLLLLNNGEAHAQTGYFDPDSLKWTKIDTLGWGSHSSFLAFYDDTTLRKIRIDRIGNSSSTTIYHLQEHKLSYAVFVHHDPVSGLSEEHYYFSNGKMIKGRMRRTSRIPGEGEDDLEHSPEKESFVLEMYERDLLRLKKAGFIK